MFGAFAPSVSEPLAAKRIMTYSTIHVLLPMMVGATVQELCETRVNDVPSFEPVVECQGYHPAARWTLLLCTTYVGRML